MMWTKVVTRPILDTLQKNDKFLADERSYWYQKTKGFVSTHLRWT
jgi:hypothetical protein